MERKLYYGITTPGMVLTLVLGIWMLADYAWAAYGSTLWLQAKLALIVLLVVYHLYCGKLVAAYGFHDGSTDEDAVAEIRRDIPNMHDLRIDGSSASSSNPDLQIDLGGIAKGYAIGLIGDLLERNGIEHYVINAGGDLLVAGNRFGQPWRIGIQNPFAPGVVARLLKQVRIDPGRVRRLDSHS